MAALATLIDGRYSGTYNAVDVGITDDGFDLIQALKEELINESDKYGGSLIDYLYRGGDVQMRADCKEYKPGSVLPFWPWGALGVMATTAAPIGRQASAVGAAMVLTSTPATPAAATPASLTVAVAILAPGQQGTLKYTSKLRKVPIFLQSLPQESGGTVTWFTMT